MRACLPTPPQIGYQCPVVLDNGRPCSGKITRTHHKQPQNQKRKAKRVEEAAIAAAAPKPKPAPKPKEPKAQGVVAATAAMRSGDGTYMSNAHVLRSASVNINNVKSGGRTRGLFRWLAGARDGSMAVSAR